MNTEENNEAVNCSCNGYKQPCSICDSLPQAEDAERQALRLAEARTVRRMYEYLP